MNCHLCSTARIRADAGAGKVGASTSNAVPHAHQLGADGVHLLGVGYVVGNSLHGGARVRYAQASHFQELSLPTEVSKNENLIIGSFGGGGVKKVAHFIQPKYWRFQNFYFHQNVKL